MAKYKLAAGAFALAFCCAAPAFSQSLDSTSGSLSNSQSTSGSSSLMQGDAQGVGSSASTSQSGSRSASGSAAYGNAVQINNYLGGSGSSGSALSAAGSSATGDPTGVTAAATDPPTDPLGSATNPYTTRNNVGGTTTSNIHYSGSQTLRNTPSMVAPSVYAGTNPCAVGGSAAGAGPGIGISFGITTSSHECTQRAWYVLMMQSAAAASKVGNAALAARDIQWASNIACNQIADEAPPGVCISKAEAEAQAKRLAEARAAQAQVQAQHQRPIAVVAYHPPPPPPHPAAPWCTPNTISEQHLATLDEGQRLYIRTKCGLPMSGRSP